jgi:hypothetical protein
MEEKPDWCNDKEEFPFCGVNAADCPVGHLLIESV